MDKTLYFSLIIPTYNRAHLIGKTIASALNQDYEHFEIIVIDDGSTDNTREVVAGFADSRVKYHYKKNEERGKARNTGMQLSKGDYITFLDSDDLLYRNHFSHAAKVLATLEYPHFYKQGHEIRNEKGKLVEKKNKISGDANLFILRGNYFSCIGVFLKREVTYEIQFSNERHITPSEDWDYWLRLSVRYKFFYDNTITSCMINHDERSMHNFNEKMYRLIISKLIHNLKKDPIFIEKREKYIPRIKAQMYTLLCLNKVVSGKNEGVRNDFLKSIKLSYRELFKKRSLVIFKFYLLNLCKRKRCAA